MPPVTPDRLPTAPRAPGTAAAWAVLLCGVLFAVVAWRWSVQRVEHEVRGVFDRQVQLITDAIGRRMEEHAMILRGAAGLFAGSQSVERAEWARFVSQLEIATRYPGIAMLAAVERVGAEDVARHVEAVRAEGFPEYRIHPEGARAEYFPVVYLEPMAGNDEAFGYDLLSEPIRRAAAERGRDTGQVAVSARIQLVRDASAVARPAFVMVFPLYRDLPRNPTVDQRRAALRGFVAAAFRMNELMAGVVAHRTPGIVFEVFDGTSTERAARFYEEPQTAGAWHRPVFYQDVPLEVGGHTWMLRFRSQPRFEAALDRGEPLGFLLGGLALAGLIFWMLRMEARARVRALGLAGRMTSELRQREARLRQATAEIAAVVQALPDLLFLVDGDGTILDWRAGRETDLYVPPTQFLGRRVRDVLPPPASTRLEDGMRRARATQQPATVEYVLAMPAGESHYEARFLPLGSDQLVVLARDITERVRAEETLRQSRARLSDAERVGRTGNWHWDVATDRLTLSDGSCRLFGLDPAESGWTAQSALDRVHPEDAAIGRALMERIFREKCSVSWDFRIVRPDGEVRSLSSTTEVVLNDAGELTAMFGTTVDITDRKRAEEALRESEQRFRQLADSIDQVFWIIDLDPERLVYASPAFEAIWGRSRDEVYGHLRALGESIHPDDHVRVIETFSRWIASGAVENLCEEYRIVRPDGGVRWLLDTRTVLLRQDGRPRRVGGVVKDVTAAKAAQETKERLEVRLRQAEKMEAIGTLAGGIAHDFNNILGCILGFTELARAEASGNPAVLENLANVLDAGQRAKGLVEQIVGFSRQQDSVRRPLALEPVVRHAIKFVRAVLPASIDIRVDVERDLPLVLADATQIHQLLMNLATNAAHAMTEQGGRLDVELRRVDVGEALAAAHPDLSVASYVRLAVRDCGPGIDPAVLDRIFEPFFTTKGPTQGTGLGLSVVHGIVKSHRGAILVHSRPGAGATFEIFLPIAGPIVAEAEPAPAAIPRGHAEGILFVDDEPLLAEVGRRMLEGLGYRVTAVTDPIEALETFRAHPEAFAVVVTDLTMPAMSGTELTRQLLDERPGLPVLLSTGFGGRMTPETARSLGIRDVLVKPIAAETLAWAVHRALGVAPPAA
ncbi:MAG: CHASE domain-containing protein [Candidatus Binatia bacterium]